MGLKYSPIYFEEVNESKDETIKEKTSIRRKGLEELAKVSITDPFTVKAGETREKILDNLLLKVNNFSEKKNHA